MVWRGMYTQGREKKMGKGTGKIGENKGQKKCLRPQIFRPPMCSTVTSSHKRIK